MCAPGLRGGFEKANILCFPERHIRFVAVFFGLGMFVSTRDLSNGLGWGCGFTHLGLVGISFFFRVA